MVSFEYACLASYEMVSLTLVVALLSTVRIASFSPRRSSSTPRTSVNMDKHPDANSNKTIHTSTVHLSADPNTVSAKNLKDTELTSDELNPTHEDVNAMETTHPPSTTHLSTVQKLTIWILFLSKQYAVHHLSLRWSLITTILKATRTTNDVDNEVVTDQTNIADNHPRTDQDVDDMGVHTEDVHIPVEHKINEDEMITHEQNATDQDVDDMEVHTEDVHISGEHKLDDDEMTTHEQNATDKVTFTQMVRRLVGDETSIFKRNHPHPI
ncbi:hypothetical protein Bca101_022524 [Brassica carinata]